MLVKRNEKVIQFMGVIVFSLSFMFQISHNYPSLSTCEWNLFSHLSLYS